MKQINIIIVADKNYLLMALTLIWTIKNVHKKQFPIYLVNAGFDIRYSSVLEYLGVKTLVNKISFSNKTPIQKKSHIYSFLKQEELLDDFNVIMDSDIFVQSDWSELISKEFDSLMTHGKSFGLCIDQGPYSTISQFVQTQKNTKLFEEMLGVNALGRPYLNSGFLLTTKNFNYFKYAALTEAFYGEDLFDQNAINLMFYQDDNGYVIAPSWNVHGHKNLANPNLATLPVFNLHLTAHTSLLRIL